MIQWLSMNSDWVCHCLWGELGWQSSGTGDFQVQHCHLRTPLGYCGWPKDYIIMFGEMMCFSEMLLLRQREIVNAEGTRKVFKNNYGTWNFTEFLISLKIFLVINGLIKQKYLIYLKTQSCCKEKVVRVFPHLLTFNLTESGTFWRCSVSLRDTFFLPKTSHRTP